MTLESYLFPGKLEGHLSRSRAEALFRELCFEVGLDMRPVSIKGKLTAPRKGNRGRKEIPSVRYNVRPHGLRKFFRTALAIAGVDRLVAEALMGHSLSVFGVESIYNFSASRIDYVREQYLKAVNHLLILRKPRGLEVINGEARKRIEELEEELKKRDKIVERMREELETMRADLEGWKKTFNQLLEATGGLFMIDEKGRLVVRKKAMTLREWDKEVEQKTKKKKRKKKKS